MKKTIVTGILAAALITGGTGIYMTTALAKENPGTLMQQHQGMDMEQMNDMMNSGNIEELMESENMNFGQMKPYMKKMHSDLSNQQLQEHYKEMHGTGGSDKSNYFKEMM